MSAPVTTRDRLLSIYARQFGAQPGEVLDDTRHDADLRGDSLDLIELLVRVEEEFGVEIDDDEGVAAGTFGEALALIERKLGEKAHG